MAKEVEVARRKVGQAEYTRLLKLFGTRFCGRDITHVRVVSDIYRNLPLAKIEPVEASSILHGLCQPIFMLNKESESIGVADGAEVEAFLTSREQWEFGDWFMFDSEMQECVFLHHDEVWYRISARDPMAT